MEDSLESLEEMERRFEAISKSLEEVGAERDENLDAKISIEIKEDKTEAYLVITPPKIGGKMPLLRDIFDRIKKEGIPRFDEAPILEALEKRSFTKPILIARGTLPTKGEDAQLEVKVRDGEKVKKDEVIAIKRPPTMGSPGVDVFGREIPGLLGEDIEVVHGLGVRVDGLIVYASREGEVRWMGNRVEVMGKEEIKEVPQEDIATLERAMVETKELGIDGRVDVEIDKDELSASIIITAPRFGGRPVDLRAVMEALSKEGIVGVDEEIVRKALREEAFEKPIIVARGIPPIKGADGYIANKVRSGEQVSPEQLLGVKVPPSEGRMGRTVRGRPIPGPLGDDIELRAGENVRLSSDGLRAYATDYGEVQWEGDTVSVKGIYSKWIDTGEVDLEKLEREFESLGKSLEDMVGRRSNLDGKVEVILNDDKTEASIKLSPPKIGGAPLRLEAIFKTLRQMGIVEFDKERVEKAFNGKEFNKEIPIAKGTPSTKGEDAYIAYRFGITEKGKNLYREVLPGQLLLFKVNPTHGRPGRAVTGEEIPGRLGKDITITAGRGVVVSEDGTRIYAGRSGRVVWKGNRVQVEDLKEVDGDVTSEFGDIDFSGRVLIHGSVRDGVMVKSNSDILVEGDVGDATLISGASISIEGRIFGKGGGRITTRGDLEAVSCEGMIVDVGGNVIIDEVIKRSTVRAGRKVISLGRKGQIEGGKVMAGEAIDVKILGSEAKTKTELSVGKGGRVCCEGMCHPGVVVTIGTASILVKNPKRGIRFTLDGSKIKEEQYSKEEVSETLLEFKEEEVKIEELVPFVVLETSPSKAGEEGAKLLGLSPWRVDVEEIPYKEGGRREFRVFPGGARGAWMKEKESKPAPSFADGTYRITNKEDGLFLTVFPPQGGGKPVTLEKIIKEIEESNFVDIDEERLRACVKEASSEPVRIGPRQRNPDIDGAAVVEISDDGKYATLTLVPPQPGGLEITYEDVMKALKARKVVAGVKEEEIRDALSKRKYTTPIVVAEEIPPQPGKLSEIRYNFELHPSKRPHEDEEGRVDFKELDIIQNVKAGQVLATRVPSKEHGTPGQRITGEEIPPPHLDEERFPAGKNTEVSEDGLELRATIDGHVVFANERVNVEPVYEIKGNVDISTGNIDFLGTVDISGDVEDGFRVRAEGDIQVRGGVGKAILSADGSINIIQGIQSNHEGRIWAGREIVCKFVENGELFARGDITIYEEILHSEVDAGGSIRVTGKRGLIIGGRVRAKDEVTARVIGCEMATPTLIEVGVPPKVREQLSNLMNLLNEELAELEQVKMQIKGLRHQRERGELGQEKEERLSQLLHTQNLLARRLRGFVERKEMLEEDLLRCKGGLVNVLGTVYPGVRIIIRDAEFEVRSPMTSVTFFYEGGEVRKRPYSGVQE
jgi:hypothetical protein